MSAGNATANARAVFLVDPTGVPYSGARPVYTVDTNGAYVAGGGSGLPGTTAASLTQAAIEAAITTAGVNGIVNLPAGTATLSAALVPLAGQLIRGAGMRATTLTLPSATTLNVFTLSAANVTIMDLGIDGARAAQAVDLGQSSNAGAYVTGANATFRRVWIRGTRGMGISATGTGQYLTVEDCYLDGGHTSASGTTGGVSKGVYCQGTDNVKIRRNTITGWSQAVGLWFGNIDCFVTDNDIINNYGFEDAGHTVNRSACEDYGAGTGANLRNTWARNLIDGSTSRCLEIAQGVTGSRYLDNSLKNPGMISGNGVCWEVTGQTSQLTTDILIRGNFCQGGTDHADGNTINGLAYRITVEGNTFADYTHASLTGAIFVGGLTGGTDVAIDGNTFVNCRGAVRMNATNNGHRIVNNTMSEMIGSVAPIHVLSGNGHIIANNLITKASGSTNHGIVLATGGRHRVTKNRVVAPSCAISVATADNHIEGNECIGSDGGNAGVIDLTGAGCLRNIVINNTLEHTTARKALALATSADYNLVQGNTFVNGGLFLSGTEGTHNNTEPNHGPTVIKAVTLKALGAQTVGTTQATIAHGLGYTPTVVELTMTSAGTIWKSAVADATNIYLTADAAGRTAEVYVR